LCARYFLCTMGTGSSRKLLRLLNTGCYTPSRYIPSNPGHYIHGDQQSPSWLLSSLQLTDLEKGTPHRSLSVADWPEVLSEPIKACTIDNNTRIDLLNDLRKSSKRIAEVSSSFEHQCANLRIISFFELKITTDLPLGKLVGFYY
jgi:hypothetical protein